MSMRWLLSSCAVAVTLALPGVASAQAAPPAPPNPNCPPGSWFCAETTQTPAAPAGQPVPLQPLPAPGPAAGGPPPSVVYQPPPPVVVYQSPATRYYVIPSPPPVYYYRPHRPSHRPEWGINLHFEGAAFGHAAGVGSAGMGGGGLGIRYRPVPSFALESDLDFVGGRDYNGFRRDEESSTFNGLLFLNPRSRAQIYLLAGFGWSWAHATDDILGSQAYGQGFDYTYFGGQGGIGLEFRASKHFAINADARAFIRTRTDDQASFSPEFTNASGQTTNTSAGALFTGGMTFYF
jgi:hypothetical protein